jgi:hypothetical protein
VTNADRGETSKDAEILVLRHEPRGAHLCTARSDPAVHELCMLARLARCHELQRSGTSQGGVIFFREGVIQPAPR